MANKGLLLVTMEAPSSLEEEFNDWYDTEHFPQRRALPGFESASRWACLSGWPRWLAIYDLASVQAVATPEYAAVSGRNSTPWSRRILPRTVGRTRIVAEQIAPGRALSGEPEEITRLLLVRYAALQPEQESAVAKALGEQAERVQGLLQLRLFRSAGAAAPDIWALGEFQIPISLAAMESQFGVVAGRGSRMLNLYCPYHRGG